MNLLVENKVGVIEKKFTTISLDEERWGQLAETHEEVEEVVPRKVPQQVKFQPQANTVSAKPQFLILNGEKHRAGSWKEVLAGFTQALGPTPEHLRNKMMGETAARFYGIEQR